jgi:hypothetical protein
MKAALLIVGLLIVGLLVTRSLNYTAMVESPVFRGVFQGQLAVGF